VVRVKARRLGRAPGRYRLIARAALDGGAEEVMTAKYRVRPGRHNR
jgi:hypothetical protein